MTNQGVHVAFTYLIESVSYMHLFRFLIIFLIKLLEMLNDALFLTGLFFNWVRLEVGLQLKMSKQVL